MWIWALEAVAPFVLSLFFPNLKSKKSSKVIFGILCGIAICFVLGFKSHHMQPSDLNTYYQNMKNAINSSSWRTFYDPTSNFEIGYQFYVWLLSRIFIHPQWLFIITALICSASVIWFSFKYSKDPVLSITLFITVGSLVFEMSAIRQSLAMSICLVSTRYVKNNKFIPFIFMIVLAMLFHQSALVYLSIYFIGKFKYNWKYIVFLCVLSLCLFIFIEPLIELMNAILQRNSDYTSGVVYESGGIVAVMIYVLIMIFSIVFNNKQLKQNGNDTFFFFMLFIGFVFYILRYTTIQIAERISYYFAFSQIILLPNTVAQFEKKEQIIIKVIVYVLAFLLCLYRVNNGTYVPFLFFWNT